MLSFNKLNIIPLLTLYPLLTVATGCPYKEGDEPTIKLNKPLDLNGDLYSSVTLKWVDEGNNSCVYSTFLGDNKVAVKTPKGTPSEAAAIAKGDNWKKEVEALTRLSTLLGLGYGQDGRPWLFEAFYGGINLYRSSLYKKYVVPIYQRLNPNPTPHQQRICQRFLTDVRVAIAYSFMECIHVGLGHKDIHLANILLEIPGDYEARITGTGDVRAGEPLRANIIDWDKCELRDLDGLSYESEDEDFSNSLGSTLRNLGLPSSMEDVILDNKQLNLLKQSMAQLDRWMVVKEMCALDD